MSEVIPAMPKEPETVRADDFAGRQILERIASAPRLNEDWENLRAILARHVKDWDSEPSDFVRDLLRKRLFIDRDFLGKESPDLIVKAADSEHPILIPADLFVSAEGFASWAGRPEQYGKDWNSVKGHGTSTSTKVIQHYASLDTKPPVIKELGLYLQPDGKVLASGNQDGGHRIASAILRGDPHIETFSLRVRNLDSDKV